VPVGARNPKVSLVKLYGPTCRPKPGRNVLGCDHRDRMRQETPWDETLRTTCVATMLDGGHAQNALPQTAGALVNCRILPGQTAEEVQQKLKQVIADPQVTISTTSSFGGGPPSSKRDDVLKTTAQITESMWPSAHHGDGRNGWIPPAQSGHSDLRRHGLVRRTFTCAFRRPLCGNPNARVMSRAPSNLQT
jgi:hypothetical protein